MASEVSIWSEALESLLSESQQAVCERESDYAAAAEGRPLVLFGAGGLGRRTLAGLRRLGVEPAAFSDNAEGLWGGSVDGVPLLSPMTVSERFAREGCAVVTIWRSEGGHNYEATAAQLRHLGWRHVMPFLYLYWSRPDEFLPYLAAGRPRDVLPAARAIRCAFALFADDVSNREFLAQLRWRLQGDFGVVAHPSAGCDSGNEYWPSDLVAPVSAEAFVDCGAFDGDTMARYVDSFGGFASWDAFEPDAENLAALARRCATLPSELATRLHVHAAATGAAAGTAAFAAAGTAASRLAEAGGESVTVPVEALDDVLDGVRPTFVKLDVEGAEAPTLNGARRLVTAHQPLLAVSCYHRMADLWELPLLVHELCPEAHLSLRAHAAEAFDLILYAVPRERVPSAEVEG